MELERALSAIADPAVRHGLRVLQDEVRATAGGVADYAALLQDSKTLLAAQQAVLTENRALREELARIGGPAWRNRLEHARGETERLRAERQRVRDAVARLNGEQSQPRIRPNRQLSSEQERRLPRGERRRQARREAVRIDRTEPRPVEETLPPDAACKGYAEVVVQDLRLEPDNVQFRRAKYYAPRSGRSYRAPLPAG